MKKTFLAFILAAIMIFPLSACGEDKSSVEEETTAAVVEDTSVFATVPEGFRVMTVGTGSPNIEVTAGGGSTLVQYQDKFFLVDCGFNSVATLMENGLTLPQVTNMLFTHQHNDHNADFWTFFVAGWGSPFGRRSLNLVGPGVQELYDVTTTFFDEDIAYRQTVGGYPSDGATTLVNITDFTEDNYSMEIDGVTITAMKVPHSITAYAYKFEAGGETVVVSGDLTYTDAFAEFAKGADILVMDAMLAGNYSDVPETIVDSLLEQLAKAHIGSDEIGQIAKDAGVKNLVLTHIGEGVTTEMMDELTASYEEVGYTGKVTLGYDGLTVEP